MRSVLFIAIPTLLLIILPIWFLAPPFQVNEPVANTTPRLYPFLSEPAMAGGQKFGARCGACHGAGAEGSDNAPGLLDRNYASDFRNAPSFHEALGAPIPEHAAFMADTRAYGRLGFNEREMMAKFLREMRRNRARQ